MPTAARRCATARVRTRARRTTPSVLLGRTSATTAGEAITNVSIYDSTFDRVMGKLARAIVSHGEAQAKAAEAEAQGRIEAAKIEAQGRIDAAKVPQRTVALPPTTQERHR